MGNGRELPRPESGDRRSYTPKHLAEDVLSQRSAIEGERKRVTVLFADICNSVELSRGMDAEEWHEILDGFFDILNRSIHAFNGTVNQYTGDGAMALFGAPVAQEDHASRACFAALRIQRELEPFAKALTTKAGIEFAVRIGLNSGDVVVGKIGDDLRMDYTAQGHVVGLASRVEHEAPPGQVYLTEYTASLVSGHCDLEPAGEAPIRGAAESMKIYRLVDAHPDLTGLDARRPASLSRFVGRSNELAYLKTMLKKASEGDGQSVAVVGAAGIGKSRLCLEFEHYCCNSRIAVHRTNGVANGKWLSVYPTLSLIRSFVGISAQDPPETAREKIRQRLLPIGEDIEDALPRVYEYLGVPDPARPLPSVSSRLRSYRDREFIGWAFQKLSQTETTVLILEDLHWFDESALDVVQTLERFVPGSKVLMILTYRPEFESSQLHDSAQCSRLALPPLNTRESQKLISSEFGDLADLEDVAEEIINSASGNPFYIEELIQNLASRGVIEGNRGDFHRGQASQTEEVPARIHSLVAARVDRLSDAEKQILQSASVIGPEFSLTELKQLADAPDEDLAVILDRLCHAEFVIETEFLPEIRYCFKHNLTHEVVYRSLLRGKKQALHARAAEALESEQDNRRGELSARLAAHWDAAGMAGKAAREYFRAAEWSLGRNVLEAMGYFRKVVDLLTGQELDRELRAYTLSARTVLLEWISATGDLMPDEAEKLFTEGCAIAEGNDDARILLGRLYGAYATYHAMCYDFSRAPELAVQCSEILASTGQTVLADLADAIIKPVCYSNIGVPRIAHQICKRGLHLIEKGGLPEIVEGAHLHTWTKAFYAMSWADLGHIPDALAMLREACESAREHQDTILIHTLGTQARFRYFMGEPGDSLTCARESLSLAETMHGAQALSQAHYYLAMALISADAWEEAAGHLQQSRQFGRNNDVIFPVYGVSTAWLAQASARSGDHANSASLLEEAFRLVRERKSRWILKEAYLSQVRVLLSQPQPDLAGIRKLLKDFSKCLDDTGSEIYRHLLHLEAAELAELEDDAAAVRKSRKKALKAAKQIGAHGYVEHIQSQLTEGG